MVATAVAFTRFGSINLRNARHADDPRPLDEESAWLPARTYSRALSASSGQVRRDLGGDAALRDQHRLLPELDGRGCARPSHTEPSQRLPSARGRAGRRVTSRRDRNGCDQGAEFKRETSVTGKAPAGVMPGDKTVATGFAAPEIAHGIIGKQYGSLGGNHRIRNRRRRSENRVLAAQYGGGPGRHDFSKCWHRGLLIIRGLPQPYTEILDGVVSQHKCVANANSLNLSNALLTTCVLRRKTLVRVCCTFCRTAPHSESGLRDPGEFHFARKCALLKHPA